VAILEMDYPFFQRSETLGEHLVTEEGDLGWPEDALRRVDEDPVPLKSVERRTYLLLVLLHGPGGNEDVVQAG
jgi:hypothetical protein